MPRKQPNPVAPKTTAKARRAQRGQATPAVKARQEQGDRSRQAILEVGGPSGIG